MAPSNISPITIWNFFLTSSSFNLFVLLLSCNGFPNLRAGLLRLHTGFVHNYLMTCARILGNNCPQPWEAVARLGKIAVNSHLLLTTVHDFNVHLTNSCYLLSHHHMHPICVLRGASVTCYVTQWCVQWGMIPPKLLVTGHYTWW